MAKKLVILTTHFGTNFSGGSTATCEIFRHIENEFSEIVVVGTQLGSHPFKNLKFIKYDNFYQAMTILKAQNSEAVFYGDFYNSFIFILAKLPFIFTYHDNWPELSKTSFPNSIRGLFYIPIYKWIFKQAAITVTVSTFKMNFVSKYAHNNRLISNGFNKTNLAHPRRKNDTNESKKILMVGNIDQRKYAMAIQLFRQWNIEDKAEIHIYGNILDSKISSELQKHHFIKMKGFINPVPYSSYDLLLHTSVMENLPITFCEAIYHEVPIVAFNVGGSSEVVNRNNGILIDPYDIRSMIRALNQLLEENSLSMDKKVLKTHSWKVASSKYNQIIQTN